MNFIIRWLNKKFNSSLKDGSIGAYEIVTIAALLVLKSKFIWYELHCV